MRYDVTNLVKGKSSVSVTIYLYNLNSGPYTWTVTAKFVAVLSDSVVILNPFDGGGEVGGTESIAIPVCIASGLTGLGFLGVAYYFKQRED